MQDRPPEPDERWDRLIGEMRANQARPVAREPLVRWAAWLLIPLLLWSAYIALLAFGVNSGR